MDPPYKEKGLTKIIIDIIDAKILKDNGIVIIHRHKKEEDKFPKGFVIIRRKNIRYIKGYFLEFVTKLVIFFCFFFLLVQQLVDHKG